MAKRKILIKPKASSGSFPIVKLRNRAEFEEFSPLDELLDENNLIEAIQECTRDNDPEGILEVIQIYLDACERAKKKPQKTYLQFLENSSFVKKFVQLINEPIKAHA